MIKFAFVKKNNMKNKTYIDQQKRYKKINKVDRINISYNLNSKNNQCDYSIPYKFDGNALTLLGTYLEDYDSNSSGRFSRKSKNERHKWPTYRKKLCRKDVRKNTINEINEHNNRTHK